MPNPDSRGRQEKEMAEYLWRALHNPLREVAATGVILNRLEFTILRWDLNILWMIINTMPSLKELEIKCLREGPDEVRDPNHYHFSIADNYSSNSSCHSGATFCHLYPSSKSCIFMICLTFRCPPRVIESLA
jgi:hypothetical protein